MPISREVYERCLAKMLQKFSDAKPAPPARFRWSADRIRQAREVLNRTQSEFAQLIGVSLGTVRKWERGERSPSRENCRETEQAAASAYPVTGPAPP